MSSACKVAQRPRFHTHSEGFSWGVGWRAVGRREPSAPLAHKMRNSPCTSSSPDIVAPALTMENLRLGRVGGRAGNPIIPMPSLGHFADTSLSDKGTGHMMVQ